MCEIKKFNEYTATIILGFSVIVALFVLGLYAFNSNVDKATQEIKLVCEIQTDSSGVITAESLELAKSMKDAIEKHEHLIKDKYEHILEQKENIQDYLTWGGIIITIVLSIFGFFGYKSINSIEDRIKESVLQQSIAQASEKTETYARNRVDDFEKKTSQSLDEKTKNMRDTLENSIDAKFVRAKSEILKEAKEVSKTETIAEYNRTIAVKESDIESNTKSIGELQQQIAILINNIDNLSIKYQQLDARLSGFKPKQDILPPKEPNTPISRERRRNPDPFNK